MKVCIERTKYGEHQTEGQLYVYDDLGNLKFHCFTLELPWKNNEKRVSCIPTGVYKTIRHHSPKFKKSFWIKDVPDRSEILIHSANFVRQLLGCIAVGSGHIDIDGDGHLDVTSSRATIEKLWKVLPDEFDLSIEDK